MIKQHLWAPWRLEWIQRAHRSSAKNKSTACPFCRIKKEKPSYKNLVLYRDSDLMVVMNLYPFNAGHLLVIPTRHIGDPGDIDTRTWQRLSAAVRACLPLLKKAYRSQGHNVGLNLGSAAGAGIPKHLHWHIVPRWQGDVNFMPAISEVKVIPSHMKKIYLDLKPHFADFSQRLKHGIL